MARPFRIALAYDRWTVEEWRVYFLSAHRFARTRSDWHILRRGGYSWLTWADALAQQPDGILGTLEINRPIPKVPPSVRVVIVNNTIVDHPFRRVVIDGVASGRRAAGHLLSRGLAHYAYVGWSTLNFSREHLQGVRARLEQAGAVDRLSTFDLVTDTGELFVPPRRWLRSLPRPCGIVCANDGLGVRMVQACQSAGLVVPEDVLIMGIGDDEIQCVQSPVPLTSVARDLAGQGDAAARYMDRWLRDESVSDEPVLYPPGEVIERHSTRMFGEPDPLVRQALILMHSPGDAPATIEQLLDRLGDVSRRQLEMRFRKRLGCTPYQRLLQARIEQAGQLLRSTNLPVDEIAFRTGFAGSAHFSRPFKAHTGQTPTQYRRQRTPAVGI